MEDNEYREQTMTRQGNHATCESDILVVEHRRRYRNEALKFVKVENNKKEVGTGDRWTSIATLRVQLR
jgi:hypothetical protein